MHNSEAVKKIISNGCCIGCGGCACVAPDAIKMQFDRYGMVQPVLPASGVNENTASDILQVCPFSDNGPNEDELADSLFPGTEKDDRIGRYRSLFAGHVVEGEFRARGSSGGIVSWILAELLSKKMVDGVIHVTPVRSPGDRLFAYRISTSVAEILQGAKSKYYPVELSDVLSQVRAKEGRYVLVGVPCFIKAVRRLARQDAVIRDRIVFYVGLVCGHLKSKAFADCIAWQAGIAPGRLESITFRVKQPGGLDSDGVTVRGDGIEKTAPAFGYFGSNWSHGFFKYSACEYCDDVFAETADVAVGDAWLPEFIADGRGNCVVVARSKEAEDILQAARRDGRLNLQDCSAEKMAESQAGGLRHRREGLACRVLLKQERGEWVPQKRFFPPGNRISGHRKKIYLLREELRAQSHDLWIKSTSAGDFTLFRTGMEKLIRQYNRTYNSFPWRLAKKAKRILSATLKK